MLKENTSVYVPIETPDHKGLATILAVVVHLGVLGFIIYTNHAKPINDTPIEMSLVTPEQLAMIQGQAAANQQAQANSSNASNSNATESETKKTSPNTPSNPAIAAYNNDLAARQAKWQRDQQAYASQLDKEAQAEQDKFANQLTEDRQKQIDNLNDLRDKMAHPEVSPPLTPTKMPKTNRVSGSFPAAGATGEATDTNTNASNTAAGQSQNTSAGGGAGGRASYRKSVEQKVYSNWTPPANAEKGLKLTASFSISPSGEISNIVAHTDNPALKASLEQAIQASSSLPPPPTIAGVNYDNNTFAFTVK